MQVKIFTIPVLSGEETNEEMNRFLRSNRVVSIDKQLCTQNNMTYWTFCLTCAEGGKTFANNNGFERKEKTDYKEVLDKDSFAVFEDLRNIRKAVANEEALPAFAIFTDAELSEIAQLKELNEKNISSIKGIGTKRVEKYGSEILRRYNILLENKQ